MDNLLTASQLQGILPQARNEDIQKYLDLLNEELPKWEINTPLRIAHFIAQVGQESGSLGSDSENLNYSEKTLKSLFGQYFTSDADIAIYAKQPEKLANRIYASRLGNGDEASGDGWTYRGRGLLQVRGKKNYQECSAGLEIDVIANPDLLSEPLYAVKSACWFWCNRHLNDYADNTETISKLVNDGEIFGLDDRKNILARAKQQLVSNTGNLITKEQLKAILPQAKDDDIKKYLAPLNAELPKWDINTPTRIAHFIAQIGHESARLKYCSENLNYGYDGLINTFSVFRKNKAKAKAYTRKPEKIANFAYANRIGNGSEASGDGWKYRGRGLIQITGRSNYERCGRGLGLDLIAKPELLIEPQYAVASACWFWKENELNKYADEDKVETITKKINGGTNGLSDRESILKEARKCLCK